MRSMRSWATYRTSDNAIGDEVALSEPLIPAQTGRFLRNTNHLGTDSGGQEIPVQLVWSASRRRALDR